MATHQKDHGTLTLYRRKISSKWYCRIAIDGVPGYTKRSCQTDDEFKARQFAETLYDNLYEKFKLTGTTQPQTFVKVASEWRTTLDGKHGELWPRVEHYALRYFTDDYIDQIDDVALRNFVAWRREHWRKRKPTDATIAKDLQALYHLFDYAKRQRYVGVVPKAPSLSSSSKLRPAFRHDEWTRLVELIKDWPTLTNHPRQQRERFYLSCYVLILGHSGIRPGVEARSLTWQCIEKEHRQGERNIFVVQVREGKTGARSVKPEQLETGQALGRLVNWRDVERRRLGLEHNRAEPIFCHPDGRAIGSFKKGFRSFLEYHDLLYNTEGEARTLYSLRHTYAKRQIKKKANHYHLAANMGTSIKMLERHYVKRDHTGFGDELL